MDFLASSRNDIQTEENLISLTESVQLSKS